MKTPKDEIHYISTFSTSHHLILLWSDIGVGQMEAHRRRFHSGHYLTLWGDREQWAMSYRRRLSTDSILVALFSLCSCVLMHGQDPEILHGLVCYPAPSFPLPYLWHSCSLSLPTQVPQPANRRNGYFTNSSPSTTSSSGQWKMCLILSQCILRWPLPSLQMW